jgi:tetraacyldisaccharide 4'-kinase
MVIWLAEGLSKRSERIAILSRGYRGRAPTDAPGVAQSRLLPAIVNDEIWMLSQRLNDAVRLGVGRDRRFHAFLFQREGIEWYLLDDGFQHVELDRDVDIVLIDATDPFGGGHLLPAGGLREPKSALGRADIVVITRSEHAPAVEAVVRRYTQAPIYYATTELKEIYPGEATRVPGEPNAWLGRKAFAFCAIGNPEAFFADARRWGMEIVGQQAFRDHHRYTERDRKSIESQAQAAGAEILLCTEKDVYNLRKIRFEQFPLYVCRIWLEVRKAREFWNLLDSIVARKRGGMAG